MSRSDYDTSTVNYGQFEKQSNVPDFARYAAGDPNAGRLGGELGKLVGAKASDMAQLSEMLETFGKGGKEAYMAKVNKDRRDAAEARRKEIEARQKLAREKSLAEIRAQELQLESGGKAWGELNEKEKFDPSSAKPEFALDVEGKTIEENKKQLLAKGEKSNELLKAAYQQKSTEKVLQREQIEFDEASGPLVTSLRQQFLDQKNQVDEEGNLIGVQSWPEFASAKLEIIKTEQGEVYQGLPQLGAAGKNVPLNYKLFYKNVASYEREDKIEKKQNAISAQINEYLPSTDLSKTDNLMQMVQDISAVPSVDSSSGEHPGGKSQSGPHPSGKKLASHQYQRDANGKVVRLFEQEMVHKQVNKRLQHESDNATSSNAPVFKILTALDVSKNPKAMQIFNRKKGVGDAYRETVRLLKAKKLSLMTSEKASGVAYDKKQKTLAKQNSNLLLIRAEKSLLRSNLSSGNLEEKVEGDPLLGQIEHRPDGTSVNTPSKLESLGNAYISLSNSEEMFAKAEMHDAWKTKMQALNKEINELDPNGTTFNVPENSEATAEINKYRALHAKANLKELREAQVLINTSEDLLPWQRAEQSKIIKELTEQQVAFKATESNALTLEKKELDLKKQRKELGSGETKQSYIQKTRVKGVTIGSGALTKLLAEAEASDMTSADKIIIGEKIGKLIDTQKTAEQYKKDVGTHAKMLQEATSLTDDGKFKSLEDIQKIMEKVGDIKDPTLRSQMNTLLAARAKGAGEFKIAQENLSKEIQYKKELLKLTSKTERQINELAASTSLPKILPDGTKNPKYKTISKAKQELEQLETEFFNPNSVTGKKIAEGDALNIKGIDNEKRFTEGLAAILSQRTENEIAEDKKNLVKKSRLQDQKRDERKSAFGLEVIEIMKNPTENVKIGDEEMSPLDRLYSIISAKETKIHPDGHVQKDVELYSDTEQKKIILDFKVEETLAKKPVDTSDSKSKIEAFTNIQNIKKLSGSAKQTAIEDAEEYIKTELTEGRLSSADFNTERTKLHNIADGKPATKKPVLVGEDHISSYFSGHMSKWASNKRLLERGPNGRVNEDSKLYNLLSQEYNAQWAALVDGDLKGKTQEELTRAAIQLAGTFTKVYPKDEEHPVPGANQRLRRYTMSKEELRTLVYKEQDEADEKRIAEKAEEARKNGTQAPTAKTVSESEKALNADIMYINDVSPHGFWSTIIQATSNTIGGRDTFIQER